MTAFKAPRYINMGCLPTILTEKEANWFAAAFLMPEKIFKQKLKELNDIEEVADYFGVTRAIAIGHKEYFDSLDCTEM